MKTLFSVVLGLTFPFIAALTISNPVHSISEDVLIMQMQTAGASAGTASQEFVLLYNSSDLDINISGWCLGYSSAGNGVTFSKLGCVDTPDVLTEIWIEGGGYASFASDEFADVNTEFTRDFILNPGMAAAGGHLRLIDEDEQEIDRVGWGGALAPEGLASLPHIIGNVLSRNLDAEELDTDVNLVDFSSTEIQNPIISGIYEQEKLIDLCKNIDGIQLEFPTGMLANEDNECFVDICPNLDELQVEIPIGYEKNVETEECGLIPLETAVLFITELLPNAPSVDTGQEFIEIYNPNKNEVELAGYRLQIGPGFTKEFVFYEGVIKPAQYLVFSDTYTKITLPNSTGQQLRLIAPAGNTVSISNAYTNADDDVSWALIEDVWIFTNQITPGAANKPYLEPVVEEVLGVTSVFAPCPAGKIRNPETNRCRTIETAVSQLTPCGPDEFRNPETNRCKKIASSGSALAPCSEGQERNPDTNRCRKITVLGDASGSLPTITDISVDNTEGSVNWFVVSVALLGTISYMAYEWRGEVSHMFGRMKQRLVQ